MNIVCIIWLQIHVCFYVLNYDMVCGEHMCFIHNLHAYCFHLRESGAHSPKRPNKHTQTQTESRISLGWDVWSYSIRGLTGLRFAVPVGVPCTVAQNQMSVSLQQNIQIHFCICVPGSNFDCFGGYEALTTSNDHRNSSSKRPWVCYIDRMTWGLGVRIYSSKEKSFKIRNINTT